MIKLTAQINNQPIYIAKAAISAVFQTVGNATCVACYDEKWYVTETPDQVLALIKATP